MNRRGFLATGVALALAGCTEDGGDGESGATGSPTDGSPTTQPARTLETHPAAQDLDVQPTLGPDPAEATGVVVAFEDPSCPTCARFEREVVPQLRAELVEPGTLSYVFRGYPVIYPWGEQGTRALEAVYDRDPATHWTLATHYFENQNDFRGADPAVVYDRTEAFLSSETDLDATATLDAARNGEFDAPVTTDFEAGQAAGAGFTTPHLFLFRDGEFRTKSAGYTPLSTIKSVLEV